MYRTVKPPVYDSSVNKYTNQSVVTGDISGGNEGDTLVINSSGGIETNSVLRIDTVNNRVGINKDPTEDLDIDGNIQINTSGLGRLVFYDSNDDHEHSELDGDDDGVNGGMIRFFTKVDGGSVTEKLRINNVGAVGFNGQYGISGEVLTSQGTTGSPIWTPLNSKVFMSMNATDLVASGVSPVTVNTWTTPTISVPSGLYVSSTDIFNPPRNGYYSINFQTTIRTETSNGAYAKIWLYKNGSIVIRSEEMEANPATPVNKTRFLNINIIISMTPSDTLEIRIQGDNSFRMLGSPYTNLSIHNVD